MSMNTDSAFTTQTLRTGDFMVQSQHGWRVTGGEIVVSLDALGGGDTRGIARVKVPEGDRLVTAGGHCPDRIIVSAVWRSHECWVDAKDADERFIEARPSDIEWWDRWMGRCGELDVHFAGDFGGSEFS